MSMTFHTSIEKAFLNFLMMAKAFKKDGADEPMEDDKKSSEVQLYDCLQEFKQSEVLDEDNKWYCNKCQDFV